MTRRALLIAYGLWMGVLTAIFFALPAYQTATWAVIGITSALAILVGVRINNPPRTGPWLLLFGGMVFYAAADLAFNQSLPQPIRPPWTLFDDALFLVSVILFALAFIKLTNVGQAGRDRAALIDALVLILGAGLLTWVLTVESRFDRADLTLPAQIIVVGYPLADIVILALVARLVTAVRWTPSVALFSIGTVGLLTSEVLFRVGRIEGVWLTGTPLDLGYVVFYVAWGAAVLHPSMRDVTERRLARQRETTTLRLILLAISALIPPGILLFESITFGPVQHGVVIAIASGVMFLLVLLRLGSVGRRLRDQIARERGLRSVTAALVAAADNDGIADALDDGIRKVLPQGTSYGLLLVTPSGESDAPGRHIGITPNAPTARAVFDRLHEPTLMRTDRLPLSVAGRLGSADGSSSLTLASPLSVPEPASEGHNLGIMLVAAAEKVLISAQIPLTVLASQAALALDRVGLSAELSRRTSEEYFRALVHNTADVILIIDDQNRIGYASPSASAMFGEPELTGVPLVDLLDTEDGGAAEQALALMRSREPGNDPATIAGGDWTVRRREDSPVQVEVTSRDLRNEPTVRGLVVTLRDVTEKRRLERELTHRAYHDALTGLANRVLFAERVQNAIDAADRQDAVVGVLFIDLDDFKVVNDTLGHESGDEVLIAVGRRVSSALRPHDTAARLGGDEFAALIDDADDPQAIEEVAAQIVMALREPFAVAGQLVTCSASVGVGTTADAADGPELLRQADLALYVAKGAGKSQWRRYQPDLHTTVVERLEIRAELDQAVRDGGMALEYQPIVNLVDGHTAGFEALIRWNHPTRGRLLPDAFIDIAEESGLVVPIGEWVLRTAIAAAVSWRIRRPHRAPYVSVNVSARQFRTPGFVRLVRRELAAAELPPECLMLEITESLLLRDDDQVWDDLAEVRDLGVRVAIDDFGTGYSSLSYLRHVPLDVLKIDRLFTGTIASSTQQRALVDGIVRLANTLGLEVVAEGIETTVERDLLSQIGCPYGQGFLFSRPMRLQQVQSWLQGTRLAA